MTEHMTEQMAPRRAGVFVALLVGAGVAVALGVYGRVHTPDYSGLPSMGFSSAGTFKAWATTVVLVLALAQLLSALWLYGRLPGAGSAPAWLGTAHRAVRRAGVPDLPAGGVLLPLRLRVRAVALVDAGAGALAGRVRLLRRLRRQGDPGAQQARSRAGPCPSRAALLLTAVVLLWLTGSWWFFGVEGVHT